MYSLRMHGSEHVDHRPVISLVFRVGLNLCRSDGPEGLEEDTRTCTEKTWKILPLLKKSNKFNYKLSYFMYNMNVIALHCSVNRLKVPHSLFLLSATSYHKHTASGRLSTSPSLSFTCACSTLRLPSPHDGLQEIMTVAVMIISKIIMDIIRLLCLQIQLYDFHHRRHYRQQICIILLFCVSIFFCSFLFFLQQISSMLSVLHILWLSVLCSVFQV